MKNRIEVEGYLAAKPEPRFLPSGTQVANGRLGETYAIKHGDGKSEQHTNWHALSFYGDLATTATRLEKGAHLFVIGWMEQREWNGNGGKRTTWELNVSNFHEIAARTKPCQE
jgi:single stranded DNA-binding protein